MSIAKAARATALPFDHTVSPTSAALRDLIASRIEFLIEVLDRIEGDPDIEREDFEDDNTADYSVQPAVLGPKPRTIRRRPGRRSSPSDAGFGERDQTYFDPGLIPRLGLRAGVREQLVTEGPDGPTDVALLAALLGLVVHGSDTVTLAFRLLNHFGSFSRALAAPVRRLVEVEGVGEISARNLKIVLAAAKRFAHDQIDFDKPVLSSWHTLIDYCRTTMAFEEIEQFRVLFLDKKNRLIADEVQQKGTVDHTPVYPREVLKRSLELNATALILIHNHPSGNPAPSTADVQMTLEVIKAAKVLNIVVHDHIIIANVGHSSLKALRLI